MKSPARRTFNGCFASTAKARHNKRKLKKMNSDIDFKPMNLNEIMKAGEEHDEAMAKAVCFDEESNSFLIDLGYEYPIPMERLKTHLDLLGWVHHLLGKQMPSRDVLYHFIEEVCKKKGWLDDLFKAA